MPVIARFYGIVVKMFFKPKEHDPAHKHQDELTEMWRTQKIVELPPLD